MSASVDVLAVMKSLAGLAFASGADEGPEGNEPAWRLDQNAVKAHDAVAELIEWSEWYRQTTRVTNWNRTTKEAYQAAFGLPVYTTAAELRRHAHDKLVAALASCGAL